MKKLLSIILILVFVLSLASCGVDFDLSEASTHDAITMLEKITSRFDLNEGKTIKVRGVLLIAESSTDTKYLVLLEEKDHGHYASIEFILSDPPAAYPDMYTDITVSGKLAKYESGGVDYFQLTDAKMKIN